jgi:hypothetical protein
VQLGMVLLQDLRLVLKLVLQLGLLVVLIEVVQELIDRDFCDPVALSSRMYVHKLLHRT